MARIRPHERGFSLVELLVALVFTMVLMAGMANVYKASISSFYTSGEALSNVRRNRMTVDQLADDLDTACMYMVDMYIKPTFATQVPPFYIQPNMPVAGAGPNDPPTADELYFYMDQPLGFEGTFVSATGATAGAGVAGQTPVGAYSFTIECNNNPTYANMVHPGQYLLFKDVWDPAYILSAAPSGSQVTVTTGLDASSLITGVGAYGIPKWPHILTSRVGFVLPRQMVLYHIVMLQLDPANGGTLIPCLVRDQGAYNLAGFVADQPQQVITENVSGFKVYLSTNSGLTWAGLPGGAPAAYSGFAGGWDSGIRTEVDNQLAGVGQPNGAVSGRPGVLTTRNDYDWFRDIPTLVRVDVTTRTATQRAEYSAAGNTLAYRNLTQSLIFVPRHSGLYWSN